MSIAHTQSHIKLATAVSAMSATRLASKSDLVLTAVLRLREASKATA